MQQLKTNEDLEVVEVVLDQCNLLDNQNQRKPEVLSTLKPNKSYVYLLNIEPGNLAFLKSYKSETKDIIITFK